MSIFWHVAVLALKQVLPRACEAVGLPDASASVDGVVHFLSQHFSDHSRRLQDALQKANASAWKSLEIALAGESLWTWLDRGEHKALRQQIRAFLDTASSALPATADKEFRLQCLGELRAARKAGLLSGNTLEPRRLAEQTIALTRFTDPQLLLEAEEQVLEGMAEQFRRANYSALSSLLQLRPPGGVSLLAGAARYFFRREVEADRELFQGLAWVKLESLESSQGHGYAALAEAISASGERLEGLLAEVQELVAGTHAAVLDIHAEQQRHGQHLRDLLEGVRGALEMLRLEKRALQPRDSTSIHDERGRQTVKHLVGRYRALPGEQRRQLPALLNGLGKLQVAAGDFAGAQQDFQELAGLVTDPSVRAEAHYHAYRAALEQREWTDALRQLTAAMALDPGRYSLFPQDRYLPEQILGAGGFGVAILCRHRLSGGSVVIKSLMTDQLDRDVATIFTEARALEQVDHPSIIRLRDCGIAGSTESWGYLVMDYFEGLTLEEYVRANGPLSVADWTLVARQIAGALDAAHARGILHRDIKPANILIRQTTKDWQIKIIDFGLALKRAGLHETFANASALSQTVAGHSVAGTIEYSAPEQMGKLPGVTAGTYSDIFAFGKTSCYALFKTAQPRPQHWKSVDGAVAELLDRCLAENPAERPPSFAAVLSLLGAVRSTGHPHFPPQPSPPLPVQQPVSERQAWQDANRQATIENYRQYLLTFPHGAFEEEARHRLDEVAWGKALAEPTEDSYEQYLALCPTGTHAEEAKTWLRNLEDAEALRNAEQENSIEALETYLARSSQSPRAEDAADKLAALFRDKLLLDPDDLACRRKYLAVRGKRFEELDHRHNSQLLTCLAKKTWRNFLGTSALLGACLGVVGSGLMNNDLYPPFLELPVVSGLIVSLLCLVITFLGLATLAAHTDAGDDDVFVGPTVGCVLVFVLLAAGWAVLFFLFPTEWQEVVFSFTKTASMVFLIILAGTVAGPLPLFFRRVIGEGVAGDKIVAGFLTGFFLVATALLVCWLSANNPLAIASFVVVSAGIVGIIGWFIGRSTANIQQRDEVFRMAGPLPTADLYLPMERLRDKWS